VTFWDVTSGFAGRKISEEEGEQRLIPSSTTFVDVCDVLLRAVLKLLLTLKGSLQQLL